jgi:hypothetical protein
MNAQTINALFAYLPLLLCGISAATIWKYFKELEDISTPHFKRQIARAIQTSSLFTVGKILPTLCISAFTYLFTDNVWSKRGFVRSCIASVVTVIILLLIWYLSIPDEWRLRFVALSRAGDPHSTSWTLFAIPHYINVPFNIDIDVHGHISQIRGDIFGREGEAGSVTFALDIDHQWPIYWGLPFVYNLFADFGALIITQQVLRHMSSATMRRLTMTVFVAACGILALSFVALDVAVLILQYLFTGSGPSTPSEFIFSPHRFVAAIRFPFYRSNPDEWRIDTIYGVFVWSTLTGIIWLGIFTASVVISNVSLKLRVIGPLLSRNFKVQRQPIRILRALVIILLSGVCAIYHLLVLLV